MIENDNNEQQPDPIKNQLDVQVERTKRLEDRYRARVLETSIRQAAIDAKAFNPAQVVALLGASAELVPIVDKDGMAIEDEYSVLVRTPDGQRLPLSEGMASLKQSDPYFFTTLEELRRNAGTNDGQPIDLAKLSPEAYRKLRDQNPEALGLQRRQTRR